MQARSNERGYTLIVVIVLLAVLLVVGAGAVRMATSQVEAAASYHRDTELAACARAAKQVLVSQLRFRTAIPTAAHISIVDAQGTAISLDEGHPSGTVPASFKDVQLLTDAELGKGVSPSIGPNLTNKLLPGAGSTAGGAGARIVARCTDSVGRVREVEFLIRYGI